jgi:hypothetical protein
MGEAKQKLNARQRLLLAHPWCIYCGAAATTTDHCPPRCFFVRRIAPETYEFPACKACNDEARLDEQALAVLVRVEIHKNVKEPDATEWTKLVRGVSNNQPALMAEWQSTTRNELRRNLRETFGQLGDQMRSAGWRAFKFGPLTCALVDRFMVKIGGSSVNRVGDFDGS